MSMLPGQESVRPPHPARHLFGVAGVLVSTLLIVSGFFAAAFYVSTILTGGGMAAVISATLVDLTNKDRQAEALSNLTINPELVVAAQAKADDMASKGYFAHVSPDGHEPWFWIKEAGYDYSAAGENLAVNFSDSENVEEAWMNSPGHRANILNAKFSEIGIATARGEYKGRTTTFVVQMFGTPRTLASASTGNEVTTTPGNPEEIAVAVREDTPQILGSEDAVTPAPQTAVEETSPAPVPTSVSYAAPQERLLASPEALLRTIYIVCGLIVLLALTLSTRLEFRRHHFRQVAAAAFLLVLMGGSLALADRVIFSQPVITDSLAAVGAINLTE